MFTISEQIKLLQGLHSDAFHVSLINSINIYFFLSKTNYLVKHFILVKYTTSKYTIEILFAAHFMHQLLQHLEQQNDLDIFDAAVEGYYFQYFSCIF